MQDTKKSYGGFSVLRSMISACCGYLLGGILLLVCAYGIYRCLIPEYWADGICLGTVSISSLLSTFFAAGKGRRRIVGSLCAGALLYLMFLLTGEFCGRVFDGTRALTIAAIILLGCVVGAVVSGLIRR